MSEFDEALIFLPLGGCGEIGMNLNLYGLDGKWVMLDLGITFGGPNLPGVELVMSDPTFIAERHNDLLAIVLTHGHEDHLGAVAYLWPQLRCPVYATPFTAALLRRKLAEVGLEEEMTVHIIPLGARFEVGPFDMELITVTHSTLEPNAIAIRTRLGTVVHTGDFKIDPEPLIGDSVDDDALRSLGDEGVLALVCDSTNVFVPGKSGSEGELRRSLNSLLADRLGRILVTTFASNVARIETVVKLGQQQGRQVVLAGRSLWRTVEAAREAGYLRDLPPLLSDDEVGNLPPEKLLILATGSQGEPRAALAKIAVDSHPRISLESGDLVVFSSKVIPGNDKAIYHIYDNLQARGIEVITEADHFVHVSGHPARDELIQMYGWTRPVIAIPVHGERRHLIEHEALAKSLHVPQVGLVENGCVLKLAPGPAEVVDRVRSGRLVLDGNVLVAIDSEILRARRRLMRDGIVFVILVMDSVGNLLVEPRWHAEGVHIDGAASDGALEDAVARAVEGLSKPKRLDDETVCESGRLAVRRLLRHIYGKRPTVIVELVRV
ncbi:MAG: ribonuclease J [Alphaproteobacteria bacterium]|nr:ribonuclease J [Alphaproteobacteria bacterium]MDP6238660.1 ribonuclease J [Alphaproteobacteria bacterium]MDP7173168.1 ribonuclease J [Alphaproteobacteria bacterium]MDP7233559.1 ribonuclease J [Alphaproteobacteria bacterium]MDP7487499.1 ribonuclease J [Alphaproteobacteria bacterium]